MFFIKKIALVCCLLVSSCAGNLFSSRPSNPPYDTDIVFPLGQKPYEIDGSWYFPIPSAEGYAEDGFASWYGKEFHGLPTSSVEPYDMHAFTAAHRTLPLGTSVKVTHLENNKSVVLRINDRGPFVSGRIIDLSYKAAMALDMVQSGTAYVRVEAIQPATKQIVNGETLWNPEPLPDFIAGPFTVQVGAFEEISNAFSLKNDISAKHENVLIKPYLCMNKGYYRVQVGKFKDLNLADETASQLVEEGFGGSFVLAMD